MTQVNERPQKYLHSKIKLQLKLTLHRHGFWLLSKLFQAKFINRDEQRMITSISWCFLTLQKLVSLFIKGGIYFYIKSKAFCSWRVKVMGLFLQSVTRTLKTAVQFSSLSRVLSIAKKHLHQRSFWVFSFISHKLFHIPLTCRETPYLCMPVKKSHMIWPATILHKGPIRIHQLSLDLLTYKLLLSLITNVFTK